MYEEGEKMFICVFQGRGSFPGLSGKLYNGEISGGCGDIDWVWFLDVTFTDSLTFHRSLHVSEFISPQWQKKDNTCKVFELLWELHEIMYM